VLGVAVTAGAVLALLLFALRDRGVLALRDRGGLADRWLILVSAASAPLALLCLSALGAHLVLSRYAGVSVPFAIVAIAAAVAACPRPLGALLAAAAAVLVVTGLVDSHQQSGFYIDGRGAATYVQRHASSSDVVVVPGNPATAVPLIYYGLGRLHPFLSGVVSPGPRRARVWAIYDLPARVSNREAVLKFVRRSIAPFGYEALQARIFPGVVPLAVVLEVPRADGASR
jgi:hypothetical protein